jgi:NDP-sugar pyrophosphorylase family protein
VEAVVMAAGEGRRLRPLTERYAKPVLPIDGRPVIATLLRELAGIERVTLVTGHLAEQVEHLVGDGSGFGLQVQVVRQPSPDGSADAVARALAAGAEPPFVVVAADTVFVPGDLARFAEAFAASEADAAIAWRTQPPPEPPDKPAIRIEEGRVQLVLDPDPENPRGSAPLHGFGPALVEYIEDLHGPPFELAEAYQRAIDDGGLIAGIEIGKTRDLTHPLDLVKENFPYLKAT